MAWKSASVPQVRFRGLQMTEQSIFAMATREQFDAALLLGEAGALPPSWESHPLAPVRFGLFAAPPVAKRLAGATLNRLRAIPFITPISFDQGQWVATEDGCPLSVSERIIGHEVRTIALGLDIAAETNHVVFGPLLAARHHLAQGRLAEVRVDTWVVTRPLTFALNVDRVSARSARSMLATLRALKSD